jgi:hypothetical protein
VRNIAAPKGGSVLELISRVRAIMLTPRAEWPEIANESSDALAIRYVAMLAPIPSVAWLVGGWLIGGYTPLLSALVGAAVAYALSFVTVFAVAFVVDQLAARFDAQRSYSNALRLTVYSFTPVWLAGIALLVPGASFLALLGLYGIYLMWTGLPVLMRPRERKLLAYAGAIAVGAIAIDIAARLLVTATVYALG